MRIIDLKCAVIGNNPVVRIVTDEGISGYGEVESYKPYLKPHLLALKPAVLDQDPTDVERVMLRIRQRGGFKPWGSAVSAVEMALWDIAGKAAGLPVYKLLGGKVRDRVRVYNGAVRFPMTGYGPRDFAENMAKMKAAKEGFTIIKQGIGFHSQMKTEVPDFFYGEPQASVFHGQLVRGMLTERGLNHVIACVKAMKEVLGDEIGLCLDCGPGWTVPDAIRLAKALEPLNLLWLEDLITGDYIPYVHPDVYREVTRASTTPIHTGEQIYLRHNFKQLIESHAVNIVGHSHISVGLLNELGVGLVLGGRDNANRHAHLARRLDQARCHIIGAIPHIGHIQPRQFPRLLPNRKDVGQGLAGMTKIAQAIDHGYAAPLGKFQDMLMLKDARHNAIDIAAEDSSHIGCALPRSQPNFLW